MAHKFLKGRRIKVSRVIQNGGKVTFEPYVTGFVTDVEKLSDSEKITVVHDCGEVVWFIVEPGRDSHSITVLDWNPKDPHIPDKSKSEKSEDKKTNRFDLMDLEGGSEET